MNDVETSSITELFRMSAEPMCVTGDDGRIVGMNDAWTTTLGYPTEALRGRRIVDLVIEGDRAAVEEALRSLDGDASAPIEVDARLLAADGSVRQAKLIAWLGRDGRLHAIVRDRTEVRRLEDALRRMEQRQALYFQQTPLAVIDWNLEFEVVSWNPSAERVFGHTRAEAIGRHARFIVPEAVRPHVDGLWSGLLAQRGGTRSTNENITKDGRIILCEWYNTPLVNELGQVIGVASLVDDVTEQKRAEEALRARERAQAEMIQRLSTPVLEIWDGILTLPILGAVDAARAARMRESLLAAIVRTRAAFAILDVTGMEGVDASTADHLRTMVQATRLLGSQCIVSGISPEVAQALVQLELAAGELTTFGTLRDALRHALEVQAGGAGRPRRFMRG